jgi:hypothetical protein
MAMWNLWPWIVAAMFLKKILKPRIGFGLSLRTISNKGLKLALP